MRWFVVALIAGGCGRLGFATDATDAAIDARPNVNDAGASLYALAVHADAPMAYWRFSEPSGAVVRDEIGNVVGTLTGGITRVTGAMNDGDPALRFDGSSGRIDLGDVFPFTGSASYTIELWARRDSPDDKVRWMIMRDTNADPDDGWQIYTGSNFTLHSRAAGGVEQGYAGAGAFAPGVWEYVVATYDGSYASFYVDGVYTGGMLAQPIGGGPGTLTFGDTRVGQFYKFDGVLDDIAFYPRALTTAQILAHYRASGR